jgi:TonB family protein
MTEAWSQWEGQVINGEFHLNKYLGGSDASAVFLAEGGPEHQPSAIKLIAADPAGAEPQLLRWGLAQKLSHPHLIGLLRKGRCRLGDRDLIFAVMEYAEENLAQILLERPLTAKEAGDMLVPTLDALAYLHSQGFVHGHLKPANVLAMNDQLKLSSDSICRINEMPADAEKLSMYDPPEVAVGVRSPATDVWSLGMTLVEVLRQHLPSWNANSEAQADRADPVLPDDLPEPFLDIVRGCLRRDPRLRLTIAGLAARLYSGAPQPPAGVAVAKSLPQKTLPQNPPTRSFWDGPAIRRFAFPAVIVAAAVTVAMLAGSGLLRHQPQTQPDVAVVQPQQKPDSQPPSVGMTPANDASHAKPKPASLRSEAPSPAVHAGSADNRVSVVQQVLPDVPQTASDTIHGTIAVSVRVKVDASGKVVGSDLDSGGPSKYFARLSLEAAQRWRFAPTGQDSGREFVLRFEFRSTGTKAFVARARS